MQSDSTEMVDDGARSATAEVVAPELVTDRRQARKSLRALLVEDSQDDAELVVLSLKEEGFELGWHRVDSVGQVEKELASGKWDVVLCDHDLPSCTSVDVLGILRSNEWDIPCLVVSGAIGEETAVDLLHQGAHDFVNKASLNRLGHAVARALASVQERRARRRAEEERARLLEQLEYERSLLRSVLLHLPAGVVIAEAPDGKLILHNPRAAEIWQVESFATDFEARYAQVSGCHPDGRPIEADEWPLARALFSGETVIDQEIRTQRQDGGQTIILGKASPVLDATGNVTAAVAIFDDVTESRALHEAVRESEARFRGIAETVPGVVLMLDSSGSVEYINPFFFDYTSATDDGDLHGAFFQTVYEEDREGVEEQLRSAVASREATSYEFRFRRNDGSLCWFMGRLRPVNGLGEEPLRWIGFAIEVHELKETQAELKSLNETLEARVQERTKELWEANAAIRQTEERFSRVFYASPTPIVITALQDGCVIDVNQSCAQVMEMSRDDMLGKTTQELGMWQRRPFENREAYIRALHRHAGSLRNLEWEVVAGDGRTRSVLASCELIELSGEDCIITMFVDVTDRKQTEEQLMAAIQDVMSDTQWFSRKVLEKLAQVRADEPRDKEMVAELTRRERQVLRLVAHGKRNDEIARELGIAAQTVRNYMATIYDKTNCRSRAQAVVWARERGIV